MPKEEQAGILKEARDRWDRAYERERSNQAEAYSDLEFLAGEQWDEDALKKRKGRPCLRINKLPQFVHQVTGDIRQMRPSIKVVGIDDFSDPKVADIKAGLIRYIENRSDAQGIYFQAADQQVAAGIGHWRVLTEYADDSTFEQEIRIAAVDDGIAVLWDPDAKALTREDASFCFVPVDYTKDGFKDRWPNASCEEFQTLADWTNLKSWYTGDIVRVAEYWVKKPSTRKLALTPDGKTLDLTDLKEPPELPAGSRIEERQSYKICRYLITGAEVLEGPYEWPGRHIPIVPLLGEEIRIGKKLIRNGIVRHAKDPQRLYNYARSAEAETIALQPKAPFMVTEQNVAKYQDIWETANDQNWPYLPYEPDSKNSGAAPQRVAPPVSSSGISESIVLANDDMKSVIGIYDASLGNKSNETSGVAIKARQREGDTGSYLYIDNFARAIRRTGQILIDLMPHIYDTERTIRIMGEDGRVDMLKINQAQMQVDPQTGGMVENTLNDITIGAYDVVAEVGPSYTTRREEAKEGMIEFLKAAPDTAQLVLDMVAKAQDWPMADKIAKRIRAAMPQHILQAEEAEEKGASPEEVQQLLQQGQQAPPDPKVMAVQAKAELDQNKLVFEQNKFIAELQQKNHELQADLEKAQIQSRTSVEVAQISAGVGMHKTIVDAATAQYGAQVDAQVAREAQERQAETARHQAETRAHVDREKAFVAADTARYATDNRPEPRAQ